MFPGCQKNMLEHDTGCSNENTGCPKKMQNFQNGQIGQVRYQITSILSQGVKKIILDQIQGVPTKIQGVPKKNENFSN